MITLGEGDVAEAEVLTPVSPGQEATSTINDNYLSYQTAFVKVIHRLDKSLFQRTFQTLKSNVLDSSVLKVVKSQRHQSKTSAKLNPQDVSRLVLSHAHSASFCRASTKRKV